MLTERLSVPSMAILAVTYLLSLNACVSMGLASVEAGAAITAMGTAAAIQNREDAPTDTEVRGNYETGFWFDRDLFSVWVTAHSADEAERVESPRVFRRLFCLSQAAMADSSSWR